jgi:putative DNA primase/helicase
LPLITTTTDKPEPNTGKRPQIKRRFMVAGWVASTVTIKPTGTTSTSNTGWQPLQQFNDSMYQPQGESVKPELQAIEGKI